MDSNTAQPHIVQDFLPVNVFLADWHVRVTWIAFTTLWVLWGFAWFIRNAFGGDGSHVIQPAGHATNTTTNANTATTANAVDPTAPPSTDPEAGAATNTTAAQNQKKFLAAPAWSVGVFNRLNRAHDMLRDLVLMLLSVLTINTFAHGSTRAVMILAWIFFAFAVVYFFVEASYEHRYLRLLYSLTFYGISLAIIGCAWHQGFYTYY
ncbi:hypothetical protein RMATCC62417_04443 [Rhizopus microsporus]|nr:hypothetical protein RMATCC62417_04443 [Rhizopus microsporus]CEI94336.1 hypothetical protein RMCBS344292_08548 [Rhizopus microsporus]